MKLRKKRSMWLHLARGYLLFNAESELAPAEETELLSEVEVKLEEAAIETTSLPFRL